MDTTDFTIDTIPCIEFCFEIFSVLITAFNYNLEFHLEPQSILLPPYCYNT